jgi:hypothetical protein
MIVAVGAIRTSLLEVFSSERFLAGVAFDLGNGSIHYVFNALGKGFDVVSPGSQTRVFHSFLDFAYNNERFGHWTSSLMDLNKEIRALTLSHTIFRVN